MDLPDTLTKSEREIAELVLLGLNNREISARRFTCPEVTGFHIMNLYIKCGSFNRWQFMHTFMKRGPMRNVVLGDKMSPSEQRVYDLLITGLMSKDIANTLCVEVATIKYHITSIYKIHGVKSRAQMIRMHFGHKLEKEALPHEKSVEIDKDALPRGQSQY